MTCKMVNVTHGKGRISFTIRAENEHPWWRDLDIDNQPLYRIGNTCDTCEALFDQIAGTEMPFAPHELAAMFREGLSGLSQDVIDMVTTILPDGRYAVSLLTVYPGFFPSAPRLNRGPYQHAIRQRTMLSSTILLPEVFLPLIREDQYNFATIQAYEETIAQGRQPTALALSVLDVRFLSGKAYEWQLAHFLLDGHHKVMAACQLGRPVTLLSFFALDNSFAPKADIEQVLKLRYH